jgi:hypothetical protein
LAISRWTSLPDYPSPGQRVAFLVLLQVPPVGSPALAEVALMASVPLPPVGSRALPVAALASPVASQVPPRAFQIPPPRGFRIPSPGTRPSPGGRPPPRGFQIPSSGEFPPPLQILPLVLGS